MLPLKGQFESGLLLRYQQDVKHCITHRMNRSTCKPYIPTWNVRKSMSHFLHLQNPNYIRFFKPDLYIVIEAGWLLSVRKGTKYLSVFLYPVHTKLYQERECTWLHSINTDSEICTYWEISFFYKPLWNIFLQTFLNHVDFLKHLVKLCTVLVKNVQYRL